MKYGHWTGNNLLPTDADGIINPDIHCIVHKAKGDSIYSKQILLQMHILRFQKGSSISRYTERILLYYAAAPIPGTYTWFQEQLSAKWRRRIILRNLKWTLMAPRERQFDPWGNLMHGFW